MKKQNRKIIAPAVITGLVLIYLVIYGALIVAGAFSFRPVLLLFLIVPAGLGAGMVKVLIARIREIRSGEEDDLSNY